MQEEILMLEVGENILAELTSNEKNAILAKYLDTDVSIAAMKVFDLLRKKFQCNYKMGRMYENLSEKYQFYDKMYNQYASSVKAGRCASKSTPTMEAGKFDAN